MHSNKTIIFLTGGNGFIGNHLATRLNRDQYEIISFNGDIRNIDNSFFQNESFNNSKKIFVHTAAISSTSECADDRQVAVDVNCNASLRCYQLFSEKYPDGTFFNFSTAHVYKVNNTCNETIPIVEDSELEPQSFYGETKLLAETKLSQMDGEAKIVNLRLFNHTHKSQKPIFFMPSVYHQLLDAKINGDSCQLTVGNLNLLRDIGHIDDLVDALALLFRHAHKVQYQTVNICSGVGKSLKTIVELLSLNMNVHTNILVDQTKIRKNEPKAIIGSNSKLRQMINWDPIRSQSEKDLVRHFLE